MAENRDYLIHELAEQANVSVRTIRYYLDQGLLPPPQVKGRYALFNSEHLGRLELIRRLKDAYLPLREIRQKMDSLTGLEVRDLLKRGTDPITVPQQSLPASIMESSSALDYITRLLETHPTTAPARSIHVPFAASPEPQESLSVERPQFLAEAAKNTEGETWRRVVLSPGVELHLRQPLEAEVEKKIRKILDLANRLFHA
ncbi:MAG: MerR family transcriptional regulator [Anaerolineaceae bacterium]|nr:MerR family transcriptional regulator [Anaerolineaceae bacterium]